MSTAAIIMRSLNEQPHAELALQRLAHQTFTDYTLYNVDSGSTDGTWEVVQRHNSATDRVFRLAPEDYVPGRVLNEMVARTHEPLVVFQNADAIPMDERWLERLLQPLLANEADATMSRQIARPSAHFVVRYDVERAYPAGALGADPAERFSAVACAFRRTLWERAPFYADGYAEDMVWARQCRAHGARFRYVADAVVEHSHNYSLEGLYRRHYQDGVPKGNILGERPRLGRQLLRLGTELGRDLVHAVARGRVDTVAYNVLYRCTIHAGAYRGGRSRADSLGRK